MAVTRDERSSKLYLKVEDDSSGTTKVLNRIFSHVNPDGNDDDLRLAATSLAGLQTLSLNSVYRQDVATLIDEG